MRDMTPTVLETCTRITTLCSAIEAPLAAYRDSTDVRPEIAMQLLQLFDSINRLLARDLRRDTDFEQDGWLNEKLTDAKHATEMLIFWYLSEPTNWHPPDWMPARQFAHGEMMDCLGAVKHRAEAIATHISEVGTVSELDRMKEDTRG